MNESAIDLRVFFERRFAPHRLSDRPARARFYFDAITWLARTIVPWPSTYARARNAIVKSTAAPNAAAVRT